MVDFQSRDTRRGPTDGDDEEEAAADDEQEATDEEQEATDEEQGAADDEQEATDEEQEPTAPDLEPTADAQTDPADSAATADQGAATDPDGGPAATAPSDSDADEATPDSETGGAESSPTEVIDEAAARTADSQSAAAQSDAEQTLETTASADEEVAPSPESAGTDAPGTNAAASSTTDPHRRADAADGTQTASPDRAAADTGARTQQVNTAVVTVGTATEDGDPTGDAVEAALDAAGHPVVANERLRGDYDGIQGAVDRLVGRDDVDVVVTAGGIGVGPSAHTLEAVHPLFEKALPGFEEVYRSLLFEHRGTGVVAVRATAGIADGTPVFCLPEDPAATRVAIDEIISAEAGPLVDELT